MELKSRELEVDPFFSFGLCVLRNFDFSEKFEDNDNLNSSRDQYFNLSK